MAENNNSDISVSVIMPAYNEEDAISSAVEDVTEHILEQIPDAELIVVNDGSKDSTGDILDGIGANDPRVRVIHKVNGGHGPAIMTGLADATGEFVFLIDSLRFKIFRIECFFRLFLRNIICSNFCTSCNTCCIKHDSRFECLNRIRNTHLW